MAKTQWEVNAVNGMVRLDLGDGTHTDFMPDQANKLAALLIRSSQEAVYNSRPQTMTITFNFDD